MNQKETFEEKRKNRKRIFIEKRRLYGHKSQHDFGKLKMNPFLKVF